MDAGTIYNTWPLMGTSYFPDDNKIINMLSLSAFDDPSLVQFFHRNLAYIILIYYLILVYKVYRNNLLFVSIKNLFLEILLKVLFIFINITSLKIF